MDKFNVVRSLGYKLIERIGAQSLQVIMQLILARILAPEDFGLIALTSIFLNLSMIFVDFGVVDALIQKKDINDHDYSAVFLCQLFLSIIFYVIIFNVAPIIAMFYKQPLLITILRVMAISVVIGAFTSMQNVLVARKMLFKQQMKAALVVLSITSIFGIAMAKAGFGVWSIVGYRLSNQIMMGVVLSRVVYWHQYYHFSLGRVIPFFSFGWKMLVSRIIAQIDGELASVIIGRVSGINVLGYFKNGMQIPSMLVINGCGAIVSVLFPAMAKEQENVDKIRRIVSRGIQVSSFITFPLMIGLALIAEPLTKLLLTDKWILSVPFMQIFCFVCLLWPIHSISLQVSVALGRSDIYLKLEMIKKLVGVTILVISANFGAFAIAWGMLINAFLHTFINAFPNNKLIGYKIVDMFKDIMPCAILTIILAVPTYMISSIEANYVIIMVLQITFGLISYISIAYFLKMETMIYVLSTIKQMKIAKE